MIVLYVTNPVESLGIKTAGGLYFQYYTL